MSAANAALVAASSSAGNQRTTDRQAADLALTAFLTVPHPSINLPGIQAAASLGIATALATMNANAGARGIQVYNDLVDLELQLQDDLDAAQDDAEIAYADRKAYLESTTNLGPMEIEIDAQGVKRVTFATLAAAARLDHVTNRSLVTANAAKAYATDVLAYELAVNAAEASVASAMVQLAAWSERRLIEGTRDRDLTYLAADRTLAISEAAGSQAHQMALANSAMTHSNALAGATATRWNARAALRDNRLQAWSLADATPWTAYQASLGTAELAYVQSESAGYAGFTSIQATAEWNEALTLSVATQQRRVMEANVAYERATADVVAIANTALAESVEREAVNVSSEAMHKVLRDEHSSSNRDLAFATADLQRQKEIDTQIAENNYDIAIAMGASGADTQRRDALADVVYNFETGLANAEYSRDAAKILANFNYRSSPGSGRIEAETNAKINLANQVALIEQQRAMSRFTASEMEALGIAAEKTAIATARQTRETTMSSAREALANSTSAANRDWQIDSATARHVFERDSANADALLLVAWDAAEGTDWSEYQADLAVATLDFLDDLGQATVDQTTRNANLEDARNVSLNGAEANQASASAAARAARALAAADNEESLALSRATAELTRANATISINTTHAVNVAGRTGTQEFTVAITDFNEQMGNAAAHSNYKLSVAAVERDVTKELITQTTAFGLIDAAATVKRQAEADALADLATGRTPLVVNGQESWIIDTNGDYSVWVTDTALAFNAYGSTVQAAMLDFATQEWIADQAQATSLATAEQQALLARLAADNTALIASTSSGNLWQTDWQTEAAQYRQTLVDVWGEYESGSYVTYASQQATQAATSGDPLDVYQATYASAEATLAGEIRTERNLFHSAASAAEQLQLANDNTLRTANAAARVANQTVLETARATLAFNTRQATGFAHANRTLSRSVADASRFLSDLTAETGYFSSVVGPRNQDRLDQTIAHKNWSLAVSGAFAGAHVTPVSIDGTILAENGLRDGAVRTSNENRINGVGPALTNRAFALGASELTQTNSYGLSEVALTTALDGIEDSHDLTEQSLVASERSFDLTLWAGERSSEVLGQQTLTNTIGQKRVNLVTNLGPAFASAASMIAVAEAVYHVSHATATATDLAAIATAALSASSPSATADQFAADAAAAQVAWLNQMTPAFLTFVSLATSADQVALVASAEASRDFDNAEAAAQVSYVTGWTPLVTTLVNAQAAADDGLQNSLRDISQAHRASGAADGMLHGNEVSNANGAQRLNRADNLQQFELRDVATGVFLPSRMFDGAYSTDEAETEFGRGSTAADTDQMWRSWRAEADQTQAYDSAAATRTALQAESLAAETFAIGEAGLLPAYDSAVLTAQQDHGNDLLTADIARASALAAAQVAWIAAGYAADVSALASLDGIWNLDFTQHKVDFATALQGWWGGFAGNYTAFVAGVTAEWQTEQATSNSDAAVLASTRTTADVARATIIAQQTRLANDHLADQSELFERAVADADFDAQITLAAAKRSADELSLLQTRFGAGSPEASAFLSTPQPTGLVARTAFDAAVLPVAVGFDVTSAATNFWLTSEINSAETAHSAVVGPVFQSFLTNVSEATRLRRENVANLTSAFEQAWSGGLTSLATSFAASNSTPWAAFEVAKANAEQVRTGTLAPARADQDIGLAQADHDFLSGLAGELASYLAASTEQDNAQALAQATADLATTVDRAQTLLGTTDDLGNPVSLDWSTISTLPGGATGLPANFTPADPNVPPPADTLTGGSAAEPIVPFLLPLLLPTAPQSRLAPDTPDPDRRELPDDHREASNGISRPRGQLAPTHGQTGNWSDLYKFAHNTPAASDNPPPHPKQTVTNVPRQEQENGTKLRINPDETLAGESDELVKEVLLQKSESVAPGRAGQLMNRIRELAPAVYEFLTEQGYQIEFRNFGGWNRFWNGPKEITDTTIGLDTTLTDWEAFKLVVGSVTNSEGFKAWYAALPTTQTAWSINAIPGSREAIEGQRAEILRIMRTAGATEAEIKSTQNAWWWNDHFGGGGTAELFLLGLAGFGRNAPDAHRMRERNNAMAEAIAKGARAVALKAIYEELHNRSQRKEWLKKRLETAREQLEDLKGTQPTNEFERIGFERIKNERIRRLILGIELMEKELSINDRTIDNLLRDLHRLSNVLKARP